MTDELDGLFFRWHGRYYEGAMRDYKLERGAAAQLRQQNTDHRRTKRHRIGAVPGSGDYYCPECRPRTGPAAKTTKRKRERKRRK